MKIKLLLLTAFLFFGSIVNAQVNIYSNVFVMGTPDWGTGEIIDPESFEIETLIEINDEYGFIVVSNDAFNFTLNITDTEYSEDINVYIFDCTNPDGEPARVNLQPNVGMIQFLLSNEGSTTEIIFYFDIE
ncbi:MAG: hypothetical protein IAE91_13520 [Ignavibacteriaceae bacterium]|nr:hypothetical protein [Ignavibacteriaceae bacterium]